jgi:predicted tellurium resistance membrane protein TerC
MAYTGLFGTAEEESIDESKYINKGLLATIVSVEAMDIVFSIDSVTAALAVSDKVWILFMGAILGILMMRGVATLFVKLIEKVPELEKTAYILIFLIGAKLGVTLVGIEVPDILFFSVLIIVFLGTFVVNKFNRKSAAI